MLGPMGYLHHLAIIINAEIDSFAIILLCIFSSVSLDRFLEMGLLG